MVATRDLTLVVVCFSWIQLLFDIVFFDLFAILLIKVIKLYFFFLCFFLILVDENRLHDHLVKSIEILGTSTVRMVSVTIAANLIVPDWLLLSSVNQTGLIFKSSILTNKIWMVLA